MDLPDRHPGTRQLARWFTYDHLEGQPRRVSRLVAEFVDELLTDLPDDGPELTTGLRKLLEAKDCFVRAAIAGGG